MRCCKQCGVPLDGLLSVVPKILFGVKPSEENVSWCNKCVKKYKMYKCHICARMIHESNSLEHIKAEEYFISLIRKDHSHWGQRTPQEEECLAYYRELVRKTEI